MSDRPLARSIALWSAITVLVRAAWLAKVPPVPAWDGLLYARTALRIGRGMGYVDAWNNRPPFKPTAFYPVGYPALLGLGHALVGESHWIAGAINLLAAALATACIVALSRRAFGAGREHLPAALYALSPGAVMYSSAYMTETLSGALLVVAIVLAERHARIKTNGSAIATGLLLGLGGLVRPQALLLAPIITPLSAPRGSRAFARTIVLVGLAAFAVVLPWTARNCARLDGCALVSTNGGSNLWIGVDPEADGAYHALHFGQGCDRVRGEVHKDRCYRDAAAARIVADPWRWVALMPAKVHALLDYEAAPAAYLRDAHAISPARASLLIGVLGVHNRLVLTLALLGALFALGRPSRVGSLCVGTVLGSVAVHCVFFGNDRYHMVFMPVLAVLAGASLPFRAEHARA